MSSEDDKSCPVNNEESQGSLDNDSQGTDGDEDKQTTSPGYDDLPVGLDDPFENATFDSDLVLLVEGRRMHVHRCILSMSSPVFRVMLNSSAFVEKKSEEIPLPGKKYYAVLNFLKQLYPVYSVEGIKDDETLETVLPLAEEYQVEHVRRLCDQYVESRLTSIGDDIKLMLKYTLLCDKFRLTNSKDILVGMAALFSLTELETQADMLNLSQETKSSIQRKRCLRLEGVLNELSAVDEVCDSHDETLETVLPLAEEYQVEHVRRLCDQYIESRLTSIGDHIKLVLKYTLLCDKFRLTNSKDKIVDMAALFSLTQLETQADYQNLSQETKSNIQRKRCLRLEGVLNELSTVDEVCDSVSYSHIEFCHKELTNSRQCYACLALALKGVKQFKKSTKICLSLPTGKRKQTLYQLQFR